MKLMYNFQNSNKRDIFDDNNFQIYSCPTCHGLDISLDLSGLMICNNPKCPSNNKVIDSKQVKKIDLETFKEEQIEREIEEIKNMEKLGIKVEIKSDEQKK